IATVERLTGDARLGAAIAFYAATLGFVGIVISLLVIRIPQIRRSTGATVLHDIRDGLVFIVRNRVFLVLLLLTFTIGFFGLSFHQLMPALAKDDLNVGPSGLGLILSVNGVGGIAGIFIAGSFGAVQTRASVVVGTSVLLGASVLLLAVSGFLGSFPLAMLFVGMAGTLWVMFQISTNVALNLLVPEEFRGRVMGLRGIMWSLSPLGALMGGLVATWVNTPFAIALGGAVVVVVTMVTFAASAQIRRIRSIVAGLDAAPVSAGTWR
ncbi:MAG: MFS transporter, partial [Chloroflexi bacterium]|nr:MFS transporter [Chloroflexota bacterium]